MTLDRAFIKAFADAPQPIRERRHGSAAEPIVATVVEAAIVRPLQSDTVSPSHTVASASIAPLSNAPLSNAPLSTFTPSAAAADRLQPGLEVDELAWPKPCLELLSRARRGWDRFIESLLAQAAQGSKCFAVTSCVRGEGRTTAVLAAARHLAERGLHSVLVDADFEHPGLAQSLGLDPHAGWGDVIGGGLPLGEALIAAPAEHVTLMPWHYHGSHAAPPTNLTRVAGCFETLREQFDVILVDAMPLAGGPAVTNLARLAEPMHIDGVYLVYDARFTTPKQLKDVSARLQRAGLPPAGVIENFVGSTNLNESGSPDRLPSFAGRPLAPHA